MDFKDIYCKEKFHCDPMGVMMFANADESFTALDTTDDTGCVLESLCNFLNGDIPFFQPRIDKVKQGVIILETGDQISVRGRGYLKSVLKLNDNEIEKLQKQFLSWVVLKIISQDDDRYAFNK